MGNPYGAKPYPPIRPVQPITPRSSGVIMVTVALLLLLAGIIGGYWLATVRYNPTSNRVSRLATSPATTRFNQQIPIIPSTSPGLIEGDGQSTLNQLVNWGTNVQWEDIKRGETQINGKSVGNFYRSGTYKTDNGYFGIDDKRLKAMGWQEDFSQAASGPDGWAQGYKKDFGGKQRLLKFSEQNTSMQLRPAGGVEAKCPCTYVVYVSVTDKF